MTRLFHRLMRLWVWPIIILSSALLSAPAFALQPHAPESKADCHGIATDISDDITVLWLQVIQNGKARKQVFSGKDLAGSPVLSVDGYVNGVVLLTYHPMQVALDQTPMAPIDITAGGRYKLPYFGYLNQKKFQSEFLSEKNVPTGAGMARGRYCRFAQVPGDMLSTGRELTIGMNGNGADYQVTVRQNPAVKLEVPCEQIPGQIPGAASPRLYYMGSHPDQFSSATAAYTNRLQAIVSGIRKIETTFKTRVVDQVRILDFNGPRNAYTCFNKNNIWIYRSLFENESPVELKNIAEHETLHILSDQLGLPASDTMRDCFAKLLGYTAGSQPYRFIVSTGRGLKKDPAIQSRRLFDFINEANFIQGAKGGHSEDNMDEFCTSFLHTLVYLDQWEERLAAPLKLRDNSRIKLSGVETQQLAEAYQTVLDTVIQNISQRGPAGYLAFFQASGKKIRSPWTTAKAQIISDSRAKTDYAVE